MPRTFIPSYTSAVKTAISLPDVLFDQVEQRRTVLGVSRSQFYATAVANYLNQLDTVALSNDVDAALARIPSELADVNAQAARSEYGMRRLAELTDGEEW